MNVYVNSTAEFNAVTVVKLAATPILKRGPLNVIVDNVMGVAEMVSGVPLLNVAVAVPVVVTIPAAASMSVTVYVPVQVRLGDKGTKSL